MNKILLGDKTLNLETGDLPLLIHGQEHSGASLFTVTASANLYLKNPKILMINGYYMARDEFISQTNDEENTVLADPGKDVESYFGKPVIFVKREDEDLFIKLARGLPDINERIILIKNIDLFPGKLFDSVKDKNLLICSGNIDKCVYKESLLSVPFKTKIYYSKPEFKINFSFPNLNKYEGYILNDKYNGAIHTGILT